jgi:hypothetical protein
MLVIFEYRGGSWIFLKEGHGALFCLKFVRREGFFCHFVKIVEASVKVKFAYVYNSTMALFAYRLRACADFSLVFL